MATLTLNFSLKPHSKVNVYIDGELKKTVSSVEQTKFNIDNGRHAVRLVQYRGKNENSAAALGGVPWFAGGTFLNGDGTKSSHLIPWRATVYYSECEFDIDIQGDVTTAVLSATEKERGFIGIDNHYLSLKIGSTSGAQVENLTVKPLSKEQNDRFLLWQRLILLLTYIPLLAIIIWQAALALSNLNSPVMFGIIGKHYILLPVLLTAIMIMRIIYFLRKMERKNRSD